MLMMRHFPAPADIRGIQGGFRTPLRETAAARPNWGSPRIHLPIRCEGWLVTTFAWSPGISWAARTRGEVSLGADRSR